MQFYQTHPINQRVKVAVSQSTAFPLEMNNCTPNSEYLTERTSGYHSFDKTARHHTERNKIADPPDSPSDIQRTSACLEHMLLATAPVASYLVAPAFLLEHLRHCLQSWRLLQHLQHGVQWRILFRMPYPVR